MFDTSAEPASHHFIQALIDSPRHHVGTLVNGVNGVNFVEATSVPNSPANQPASHGLAFFERHRVAVPSTSPTLLASLLARPDMAGAVALQTGPSRWPRLTRPHHGVSGVDDLRGLGYDIVDLTRVAGIDDPNRCIVWELVEWSRGLGGERIQPIRAIPLAGFEDCVGGGAPQPAGQPPLTVNPDSGRRCTVLVLDNGLRSHTSLNPGQVDTVEPSSGPGGPADDDLDDLDDPETGGLRWFAGHGTFIAGLIHHRAPLAKVLVADVTDERFGKRGGPYIVDEAQLAVSLGRGLARARELDLAEGRPNVIVNLSIAANLLDGDGDGVFAAAVRAALHDWGGNILFLAAGGNVPGGEVVACDGDRPATFPAGLAGVDCVASIDGSGGPAEWSVHHGDIDAWALGEDVVGPHPGGLAPITAGPYPEFREIPADSWVSWCGTSFAVARATAAVAQQTTTGAVALTWRTMLEPAVGTQPPKGPDAPQIRIP